MTEERVSIGRLKARLSEYLDRTRAGECGGDGPGPADRAADASGRWGRLEGRVAELDRAGLVRMPARPLDRGLLTASRPGDPAGRSLEAVLEERAEGW
jgi:hypothetical protein